MFKEFSDVELVIMWHRLNHHSRDFYESYDQSHVYSVDILKLDGKNANILWNKLDNECMLRKLNPIKLTKFVPVEVITYENKEVPIE